MSGLCLGRKVGEGVVVTWAVLPTAGDREHSGAPGHTELPMAGEVRVVITVMNVKPGRATLKIEAPASVRLLRDELEGQDRGDVEPCRGIAGKRNGVR